MKWLLLSEALELVTSRTGDRERARLYILASLRRGELVATAERYQDYFIHHPTTVGPRRPPYAASGKSARMVPIGLDWWDTCKLDWNLSSADMPWSEWDSHQVGHQQPVKASVSGVLLSADRVNQLWPSERPAAPPKSNHRPRGTGKQVIDEPVVQKMRELISAKKAGSATQAARLALDGQKYNDSDISRLRNRYKDKYGR